MPSQLLPLPVDMALVRSADRRMVARNDNAKAPDARAIVQWITEQALVGDDGVALLDGFCNALRARGLPLWRVSAHLPALDPSVRGFRFDWRRDGGASLVSAPHDDASIAGYVNDPLYKLLTNGRTFSRWRLHDAMDPATTFPALVDLRAEGGTDYVQHIIWFTPGTALKGLVVSFASDGIAGFGEADLALFAELLPVLGLAICKSSLSRTLQETLAVYLGSATATRVLGGQIRRGEGETVAAAILMVDFRAFTALTEREDAVKVVGWLDEHFDAVGEPVARHGGEILKFIGDGFLAIFPAPDPGSGPCATCASALAAAGQALAANRALNGRRRAAGLPELDVDLVLHFGEVVYGNVGTSRRLDFTVIGRAVNEASRIEEICGQTGRSILISESFAERCGRELEPVGTFTLRGIERKQSVWTVAPTGQENSKSPWPKSPSLTSSSLKSPSLKSPSLTPPSSSRGTAVEAPRNKPKQSCPQPANV
jgi:adenylate cyclase